MVVPQRKIGVLLPEERRVDAGQAETVALPHLSATCSCVEPSVHPFPVLEADLLAGSGVCSSSWVLWVPQKARMWTLFLPAYKGSVMAGW